jgi:DNA replication protein DnaC
MALLDVFVFNHWDRIFKNPMATAAAIDRLVHHATILEIDVPSFRTEDAGKKSRRHEDKQASEPTSHRQE